MESVKVWTTWLLRTDIIAHSDTMHRSQINLIMTVWATVVICMVTYITISARSICRARLMESVQCGIHTELLSVLKNVGYTVHGLHNRHHKYITTGTPMENMVNCRHFRYHLASTALKITAQWIILPLLTTTACITIAIIIPFTRFVISTCHAPQQDVLVPYL